MKLYGTVTEKSDDGDAFVTKGKEYEVIRENYSKYVIIDDSDSKNDLSRDADGKAYYGNWFSLIPPSVQYQPAYEGVTTLEDVIVELKSINHSLDLYKLECIIDNLVDINKINKQWNVHFNKKRWGMIKC